MTANVTAPKRGKKGAPAGQMPDDVALPLDALLRRLQQGQDAPGAPKKNVAAEELRAAASRLLRAADALERPALLDENHSGNHKTMLEPAHLHRSEGALNTGDRVARFLAIARPAGHTLRSIAKAVGMKHPHLGNVLRGSKRMRPSWALQIQALTRSQVYPDGFEATEANYPAGWARED